MGLDKVKQHCADATQGKILLRNDAVMFDNMCTFSSNNVYLFV